jgi:ribonuclease III
LVFKDTTPVIDLHIHSSASDGTCAPEEIVQQARKLGLQAIAIADHDTIDGVCQAMDAGIPRSLKFMTGIEISARPPSRMNGGGSFHILGYGFSIYDNFLHKTLGTLQQARENRNPKIIEKLQQSGIAICLEDVQKICGTGQMGRPHIALALMEKKVVATFDEAFDRYLATGRPAHVDKARLSCQEAIQLINRAGGVAVLAHPGLIETSEAYPMGEIIDDLVAMGLNGIEAYHTDHSGEQTRYFEKMAQNRDLLITGGSDFHGDMKPEVQMGKGDGDLHVPCHLFETLFNAVTDLHKSPAALEILEENLGHTFQDKELLTTALRHSSYVNEAQDADFSDNQRLEFMGDAVLGLVIGEFLMEQSPDMKEGDLSKMRAGLVSEPGLAAMARKIDLGRFIFLGKGEWLSGGSEKNSILADTFEAVMAAIYLDLGFTKTAQLIKGLFQEEVNYISSSTTVVDDYKSLLQEYVQEMGQRAPGYTVSGEQGPDHAKTFEIKLQVCGIQATGVGKSKKAAEQDAAEKALKRLKKEKILDHENLKDQESSNNQKDLEDQKNQEDQADQE